MGVPGITVLGGMPAPLAITTAFVGAVAATSTQPDAARALLHFMCTPDKAELKRQHGMAPPSA